VNNKTAKTTERQIIKWQNQQANNTIFYSAVERTFPKYLPTSNGKNYKTANKKMANVGFGQEAKPYY
jgi:hypothetical protein